MVHTDIASEGHRWTELLPRTTTLHGLVPKHCFLCKDDVGLQLPRDVESSV